jgi:hypothetical protein
MDRGFLFLFLFLFLFECESIRAIEEAFPQGFGFLLGLLLLLPPLLLFLFLFHEISAIQKSSQPSQKNRHYLYKNGSFFVERNFHIIN